MPTKAPAVVSPWRVYDGQNIKGNPKMPAAHVAHDLMISVDEGDADEMVVQEFEWTDYWQEVVKALPGWGTYPSIANGEAHPVEAGQPIFWDAGVFFDKERREHLLMKGKAGISDDRWLRAVLMMDHKAPTLGHWSGTTHFVVGGDGPHDGPERKALMAHDLAMLDDFIGGLVASGYPVIWELDANIHAKGATFTKFKKIVEKHGGKFHGQLGVEYLFTIDNRYGKVEVEKAWTIPTSHLYTDHEGRLVKYRIVGTAKTPQVPAGAPGGKKLPVKIHRSLT